MSSPDPIHSMLARLIEAGELAGATTLVWRDGRIVQMTAAGRRDRDAALPMTRDTLFRIASVSKPIISVTAMTLFQDGRFELDQPISTVAPEFAEMRVLRDPDGALDDTVAASRPITFGDLLTHRSGLTYGDFHSGPLAQAHADQLGETIDNPLSPDEWIAALAALPLVDQPGAGFHYGHSTDLLGLLMARLEGAPLEDVMRRRLFDPLGMADTGFTVPAAKRHRRAKMYGFDDAGVMVERPTGAGRAFMAERPDDMTFVSGGQGLWSTADDLLAFGRLFVEGGAVDGVRILQPETLALMTRNHLTEDQRAAARMFGMSLFAGHGFGLGLAVVLDPGKADPNRCKGAAGTVGWPGAFGGWWQADPVDRSVMIFLAQNATDPAQLGRGIGLGVFAAIADFHALGSRAAVSA